MAVLSKQGSEIGRIEAPWRLYSYRDNGRILVTRGGRWVVLNKKYENISAVFHWDKRDYDGRDESYKQFVVAANSTVPRSLWAMASAQFMVLAVGRTADGQVLAPDVDGIYSAFDDFAPNARFTHADIKHLCDLWYQHRIDAELSPWSIVDSNNVIVEVVEGDFVFRQQRLQQRVQEERSRGYAGSFRLRLTLANELMVYLSVGNRVIKQ